MNDDQPSRVGGLLPGDFTYVTNSCIGQQMFKEFNLRYTNPFIGSLIPNDSDFCRLVTRFAYYTSLTPVFGEAKKDSLWALQNGSPFYKSSKHVYPVMYLEDVEIHWIHETDPAGVLSKYTRRLERMKGKTPLFLWNAGEFFEDHPLEDYEKLLTDYLAVPNAYYLSRDEKELSLSKNVLFYPAWAGTSNERNVYHVYNFSNQITTATLFREELLKRFPS